MTQIPYNQPFDIIPRKEEKEPENNEYSRLSKRIDSLERDNRFLKTEIHNLTNMINRMMRE